MHVLTNNHKIQTFKNKLKNIKSTSKVYKKEKGNVSETAQYPQGKNG